MGLKLQKAFSLLSSFDAAMRGNEQRCGKKSPTMAIEGDEAKCSHSYLDFNTSRDNGSEKHRAEGNANNDDGGEIFRLRI